MTFTIPITLTALALLLALLLATSLIILATNLLAHLYSRLP